MGLFVYTQKGSIISMVVLPTTEIIEPGNGNGWALHFQKLGKLFSRFFFCIFVLWMYYCLK